MEPALPRLAVAVAASLALHVSLVPALDGLSHGARKSEHPALREWSAQLSVALPAAPADTAAVRGASLAEGGRASAGESAGAAAGAAPGAQARPGLLDPLRYYTTRELDVRPWIMERIEPEYPETAYRRFLSGKVVVQLDLDESGRVDRAVAVRAEPGGYFEEAAEKAFLAARFTPGIKGGRPVKVRMQVEVSFDSARPLEPGRSLPRP
jgi:periplasmic protein TonB